MNTLTLLTIITLATILNGHPIRARPPAFFFPRFRAERCRAQPTLICNVQPTAGNTVRGTILFSPVVTRVARRGFRCQVRVVATVDNLGGKRHGFHIHMYGDLSAGDGLSTGPHFANPEGIAVDHGFSSDRVRHWGDLDNLIVGRDGVARYDRVDSVIQLGGIVGRGVTIHQGEDRGSQFQPTGDAGARVAVCTIGYANPSSV